MDSKFKNAFWFGNIALPIVSTIVFITCLKDSFAGDLSFGNLFFGLAGLITLIIGLITLANISKINISNNQIVVSSVLGSRKESFLISDIEEIKIKKTKGLSIAKVGYISDGYNYAEIILKGEKEITVSPEMYANWNDIIQEIDRVKRTTANSG